MKRHTRIWIFVMIMLMAFTGCRKDIDHNPGLTLLPLSERAIDSIKNGDWHLLQGSPDSVRCLETVSDKLYFGGTFRNDSLNLMGFIESNSFYRVVPINNIVGNIVNDIFYYNGYLFFGGDFEVNDGSIQCRDLLQVDMTHQIKGHLISDGRANEYVNGFSLHNESYVVFFGSFASGIAPTDNMASIKETNLSGYYGNVPVPVYGLVSIQNIPYVCINESFRSDLFTCIYYKSSKWYPLGFDGTTALDSVYSMQYFRNEIYLTGKTQFPEYGCLIRYNGKDWFELEKIKTEPQHEMKCKVIGNDLYVFGENIKYGGQNLSNILMYNGLEWIQLGSFNERVYDVTIHSGKYFIATNKGIYVLE